MLKKLWAETYRPKTIDEVIFASDDLKAEFKEIVKSGSLPNLLLTGHAGSGKTSISQALMRELKVDPADILKINCAEEQIDAIRNKVKTFAYTMPFGKFKVVRLEEMDYLSHDAQALLRELTQEVQDNCRFVATANYLNKIMPAMQSRFQHYVVATPDRDQVLLAMADILVKEAVEFEIDDLEKVVAAGYPDLRKIVGLLEKASRTGTLTIVGKNSTIKDWKLQLLPLLEASDLKGARTLVCTSATREELQDVYRFLYENVHRVKKLSGKEDQAIVLIAQYQYQHAFVADTEINVAALFIELGAL